MYVMSLCQLSKYPNNCITINEKGVVTVTVRLYLDFCLHINAFLVESKTVITCSLYGVF